MSGTGALRRARRVIPPCSLSAIAVVFRATPHGAWRCAAVLPARRASQHIHADADRRRLRAAVRAALRGAAGHPARRSGLSRLRQRGADRGGPRPARPVRPARLERRQSVRHLGLGAGRVTGLPARCHRTRHVGGDRSACPNIRTGPADTLDITVRLFAEDLPERWRCRAAGPAGTSAICMRTPPIAMAASGRDAARGWERRRTGCSTPPSPPASTSWPSPTTTPPVTGSTSIACSRTTTICCCCTAARSRPTAATPTPSASGRSTTSGWPRPTPRRRRSCGRWQRRAPSSRSTIRVCPTARPAWAAAGT